MPSEADRPPPCRSPRSVRPGDLLGVAALSGPVGADRLAAGVAALEGLGFGTVLAGNLRGRARGGRELFAGSDAERLDAFHALAADPAVGGIVFARGGYGLTRILHLVDWDLLARRRLPLVGYSDLTPLLLGVVARTGTVALHGPMIVDFARGLLPDERRSFLAALAGKRQAPWLLKPIGGGGLSAGRPRLIQGPLLGGCLTLMAASVGTGALPDLRGAILMLEDTCEPEYRIDRMLTQLLRSGQAAGVRAVVAGHFTDCDATDSLADFAEALGVPLFGGLPAGHGKPNHTLPLGATARLDTEALTLESVP